MIYAADRANFSLFEFGVKLFEILVLQVGKLKLIALNFRDTYVAVLLFFGIYIIKLASRAFDIFYHFVLRNIRNINR